MGQKHSFDKVFLVKWARNIHLTRFSLSNGPIGQFDKVFLVKWARIGQFDKENLVKPFNFALAGRETLV